PGSRSFLASTSLGLMEVIEERAPNYGSIKAEVSYRMAGSGLVELKYRIMTPKPLKISGYRVECSAPCEVESVMVPHELSPLSFERASAMLAFNEADLRGVGNVSASVRLIAQDGEEYVLPAASFRPVFAQSSIFSSPSSSILIIFIASTVIVVLAVAVLKLIRKGGGGREGAASELKVEEDWEPRVSPPTNWQGVVREGVERRERGRRARCEEVEDAFFD
ncbi:MAG: hypothetical protein QXG25_03960, partial [Nitrososphaerota archaeon]